MLNARLLNTIVFGLVVGTGVGVGVGVGLDPVVPLNGTASKPRAFQAAVL